MKVYCPFCKKEVEYNIEKREIKKFKDVEINTYENVAVCKYCNNDLYIPYLEDENTKRINNLYIEKTDIIKPQDIINLRERYNISQRELTAILGFGKMTINRYERGGIPTKSQSDYLKLLIDNEREFIKKVEEAYSKSNISKKTYEKIINLGLDNEENKEDVQVAFRKYMIDVLNESLTRKPDIYNGYKYFDIELVENIVSYISSEVGNLTITSVNKYLWYIDMLAFKKNGVSITGLTYEKQKYGPTIIDKKYELISMLDKKYKRIDYDDETGTKTIIIGKGNYNLNKLKPSEKEVIDTIIKLFKNKNVNEISNMSHNEEGWKKTDMLKNISFEYAMKLRINNQRKERC